MTQKEFIGILGLKNYPFIIKDERVIVMADEFMELSTLHSIPPNVTFKSRKGSVNLNGLINLPTGIEFLNRGNVFMGALERISTDAEFYNKGDIHLGPMISIPAGVQFHNDGDVMFPDKMRDPNNWSGNIEGMDNKRLLNLMIKQGVFE